MKMVIELLKARVRNGKLDPINIIVYGISNNELAHIISAKDLVQANWDKKLAYKQKLASLPDSTKIPGTKFYLRIFYVINPQLEDKLYTVIDENLFSEKVENYTNGTNTNNEKYDIKDDSRFLISFETQNGEKQIRVLDYDITEQALLNGEKILMMLEILIFSLKER